METKTILKCDNCHSLIPRILIENVAQAPHECPFCKSVNTIREQIVEVTEDKRTILND